MKEYELINKRGRRLKQFSCFDGTIKACIYDDDVHFLENGEYKEIDNSIIKKGNYYCNKANSFKVSFCNNENEFIKIASDNYSMKIKVLNANNNFKEKIDKNSISFINILHGATFKYEIIGSKLKESIVLENNAIDKIAFELETNLELLCDGKTVTGHLLDKKMCEFSIPFALSSDGQETENMLYDLAKNEKGNYLLTLYMDRKWLDNVQFPIIIDPTITDTSNISVSDTYIYPGDTNVNRNSQSYLKIGRDANNTYRTLIKYNLPNIGTASQVIQAYANLYSHQDDSVITDTVFKPVVVHKITEAWDETTANWNNMNNKYDNNIETSFLFNRSTTTVVDGNVVHLPNSNIFNITNAVKQWYAGENNYGLLLKTLDETYDPNCLQYMAYSKNSNAQSSTGESLIPSLTIIYRNQNGIDNRMSYNKLDYSIGNSFINIYNGNLINLFEINKTISNDFSTPIQLFYSTNDALLNKFMCGWKFDYYQTLKQVLIGNESYLEYVKNDGGIKYFINSDGIYKDEENQDIKITYNNNKYVMVDFNSYTKIFEQQNGSTYYLLTEVISPDNKSITITYNQNNQISCITDASNNTIQFTYSTNEIRLISDYDETIISLSNSRISSIQTKFGTISFQYNSNNLIQRITDIDGRSKQFTYNNNGSRTVNSITEYGVNNIEGKTWTYYYNYNSTKVVDSSGQYYTYIFNYLGNTIGTMVNSSDSSLKNIYGFNSEYVDIINENTGDIEGRTISETRFIKYANNLYENSSFENSVEMPIFGGNRTTEYARTGNYSYKSNDSIVTNLLMLNGGTTYTFSGYIKNNQKVELTLSSQSLHTYDVLDEFIIPASDDFTRFCVSFDYPTGAESWINLELNIDSNGTMYLDDLQLEEGNVANEYNMIENSNFRHNLDYWNITGDDENGPISDYYEIGMVNWDEKYLKIKSRPNASIALDQSFNISGNAGDIYHLSFLYKNEGVFDEGEIDGGNMAFLGFTNSDETMGGEPFSIYLNKHNKEWQLFSQSFVAETDYQDMWFQLLSIGECNNLYITNIMLIKDCGSYIIEYDELGNIKSTQDLTNKKTEFKYNEENQLLKILTPLGNNFSFEYDNDNPTRVLKAISPTGISNEIEYNNIGAPIKTIIKNINKDNSIISGNHYFIRLKGTNNYLDYANGSLILREDGCSNRSFQVLSATNNRFYIKINDKYIYINNNQATLNSIYKTEFKIERNSNGSYSIDLVDNSNKSLSSNENSIILETTNHDSNNQQFYFILINHPEKIVNKAKLSDDGLLINEIIDSLGNKAKFDFDAESGLLKTMINSKGLKIDFTYDNQSRVTSITDGNRVVSFIYNNYNLLSNIVFNGINYGILYDDFLNRKKITLNGNTIIEYNYMNNNGKLLSEEYGNADEINYSYDSLGRVSTMTKGLVDYNYYYNNFGNLSRLTSELCEYLFIYDYASRISKQRFINDNNDFLESKYSYDIGSNLCKKQYKLIYYTDVYSPVDSVSSIIIYTYDENEAISSLNVDNDSISYVYDELGRLISTNVNNHLLNSFNYMKNGDNTSLKIKSININGDIYDYQYDSFGNITRVSRNNSIIKEYIYDELNQLIIAKDYLADIIAEYNYDLCNNIIRKDFYDLSTNNKINSIYYNYDSQNKLKLVKYNNDNITYDNIGNVTGFADKTFIWENGKELKSITGSNLTINYSYNSDGIRIYKNVNNIETYYYIENSKIIMERTGSNVIYYIRDENGELLGFDYNGVRYYYLKNVEKDIIGIMDSNNQTIVNYYYDSWGNTIKVTDGNGIEISNSSHIAFINPYRFKGYYYDAESGLYYLNSRYYNPEWGRFISMDTNIGTTNDFTSYNLYTAFANNPINTIDPNGNDWKKIGAFFKSAAEKVKEVAINFWKNNVEISHPVTTVSTQTKSTFFDVSVSGGSEFKANARIGDADKPAGISIDAQKGSITSVKTSPGKTFRTEVKASATEGISYSTGVWHNKAHTKISMITVGISLSEQSVYFKESSIFTENREGIEGITEVYGRTDISLKWVARIAFAYAIDTAAAYDYDVLFNKFKDYCNQKSADLSVWAKEVSRRLGLA